MCLPLAAYWAIIRECSQGIHVLKSHCDSNSMSASLNFLALCRENARKYDCVGPCSHHTLTCDAQLRYHSFLSSEAEIQGFNSVKEKLLRIDLNWRKSRIILKATCPGPTVDMTMAAVVASVPRWVNLRGPVGSQDHRWHRTIYNVCVHVCVCVCLCVRESACVCKCILCFSHVQRLW